MGWIYGRQAALDRFFNVLAPLLEGHPHIHHGSTSVLWFRFASYIPLGPEGIPSSLQCKSCKCHSSGSKQWRMGVWHSKRCLSMSRQGAGRNQQAQDATIAYRHSSFFARITLFTKVCNTKGFQYNSILSFPLTFLMFGLCSIRE